MNIHLLLVAEIICCVSARMPSGYVMLSITKKRSVNDNFQLDCQHLDCAFEKCHQLSIFKDSNPFLTKDYATQEIYIYPLPGSPFRLMQFKFLKTQVMVDGEIANQNASGNFTCQMTTQSGTDTDFGEMTLYPCDNCTEAELPKNTFLPKVFSEGRNRTVGSDFEVNCDHRTCYDNACIDLNILKDDKPFLRTELGMESVNLYKLAGDPFGRTKIQKSENLTKVIVQIRNSRAGGKYSCEFVSLKGYFKDSQYLNIIAATYSRPSVKATTRKVPPLESTTVQTTDSNISHVKPTENRKSSTVDSVVDSKGVSTVEYNHLLLFRLSLANIFVWFN